NIGNLNGYNAVQNVGNQVVPGNANQNPNGNGNLVATRTEGNAIGHNGNQVGCFNCRGVGHFDRNYTVRPRRRDVAYLQTQLLIVQKEEAGIQLQAEEFDLMAAATDLDEIKETVQLRNQVAQNPRVQNDGIQNQIGNGNLVAVRAQGNAAGHNGNQIRCYNCRRVGHFARDCTVRPKRRDAAYLQTHLLIAQKEEA
nr:hypothetical protein [Tanacetum cinerariifolium]